MGIAKKSVNVCALAMIGGSQLLYAGCVQPTTCVDGVCEDQGPPVCGSGSIDVIYMSPGENVAMPPGGTGNGGYKEMNISPKVNCVANNYGDYHFKSGYSVINVPFYGWSSDTSGDDVRLTLSPNPPSSTFQNWLFGQTDTAAHTTVFYKGAQVSKANPFPYVDPDDRAAGIQMHAPVDALSWQIINAGHEAAHQSLGGIDENLADGYGVKMLNQYNADHAKCDGGG